MVEVILRCCSQAIVAQVSAGAYYQQDLVTCRDLGNVLTSRVHDLQTINSAAFVMGNAWIVSHTCGWFDNPVYWSNLIQFSCWNTVSIHGMHISCPGLASCGSVPIGWPQEKGMEIDKHAVMLMTSMLP